MSTKILFIGNSFTFYNEMPAMLAALGGAGGHEITAELVTKGGYHLYQYLDPQDVMAPAFNDALARTDWDYIVLQDQSAGPVAEAEGFFSAADRLCELARARGAAPLFYQTWSYRDGTEKLATTGMSYEEFYGALRAAYRRAADKNAAVCIPAGDAFRRVSRATPDIPLIRKDDYHPTATGSYLVALVFYFSLFGIEAPVAWRPDEVTEEHAALLRRAAAGTVTEAGVKQ